MSEIVQRRRSRLSAELEDEGVRVFDRQAGDDLLLDEIAYAIWPPVHEGHRPSYGAIVPRNGDRPLESYEQLIPMDSHNLDRCREYADGTSTFLIRSGNGGCLLADEQGDELGLVSLASNGDITIVQRTLDGTVKVFCGDRLYSRYGGSWWPKPYGQVKAAEVAELTQGVEPKVLRALLDLCLHVLSPRHVGAILVWCADEPDDARDRHLIEAGVPPAAKLQITESRHFDALAARLSQLDGACVLSPSGDIVRVGAYLGYSPLATSCVAPVRGMRHTSAKRFSFDHSGTLLFVVSTDGLVSLFCEGVEVLGMQEMRQGTYCRRLTSEPARHPDSQRTTCEKCHKTLSVEPPGAGEPRYDALECPVCGTAVSLPDGDVDRDGWAVRVVRPVGAASSRRDPAEVSSRTG